jgi:predicted RNA-binding protein (virulence factor B family)
MQPAKERNEIQLMNPGTFMTLSIDEKLDYGYYLTDGESRVLLHKTEITEPIDDKEEVEVYLIVDHEDRLAATMKKPKITEDHYDWVEVVSVREDMGAFVDIGLSKDALVANDFQRLSRFGLKRGTCFIVL